VLLGTLFSAVLPNTEPLLPLLFVRAVVPPLVRAMLAFGFPLFGLVVWADSVSRVVVVDDVAVVVGAGLDDVNGLVDGMLLLRVVVVGPRF
jgi:hypothetical protein